MLFAPSLLSSLWQNLNPTPRVKKAHFKNLPRFFLSSFSLQINWETPAHASIPRWILWMFSSSQLHALIFLPGMLSTHFLAIGKFWKMKWNSMFEEKPGIFFDFSMLVLSLLFELPTFLWSLFVICLDFCFQASLCTGLSSVSVRLKTQDMIICLLFSCPMNS